MRGPVLPPVGLARGPAGLLIATGLVRRRRLSAETVPLSFTPLPPSASLSTMRRGEAASVTAIPTDSSGARGFAANYTWSVVGQQDIIAVLVPEPLTAPEVAEVRALRSGTCLLRAQAINAFGSALQAEASVTVLEAARMEFDRPAPLVFSGDSFGVPAQRVTAIPRDIRPAAGQPAYGVNGIAWSSLGGRVTFLRYDPASVLTGEESGAATLAGSLDAWVIPVSVGADTVRVQAVNLLGQPITGDLGVRVDGAQALAIDVRPTARR